MFYRIENGLRELPAGKEECGDALCISIMDLTELEGCYSKLGFSEANVELCRSFERHRKNSLAVYDNYSFCVLDAMKKGDEPIWGRRAAFFIKRNLFLIVALDPDSQESRKELIAGPEKVSASSDVTLERLVFSFLNRLVLSGNNAIETLERLIDAMDKQVLEGKTDGFNERFSALRRKLLHLHSYYEQLYTLGQDLLADENDLFGDVSLRYFKLFTDRVSRIADNVRMLRDTAAQVRESYQAQMDIRLNQVMKLFTVVTTIFLPLTLVTGWYGMNFEHMPELRWAFAYPMVLLLCIAIVIVGLWWCKRKKIL
ncbi:MAG: CorA family divalent cation transporter [Oscillospiraceae bacterium]